MTVKGTSVPIEERDRVFEKFQHLVRPIANEFIKTYSLGPVDGESAAVRAARLANTFAEESPDYNQGYVNDLEQEGSIGLLAAAAKKGDQLTREYANKAIKAGISRECFKILKGKGRERVRDPETGNLVWRYTPFDSYDELVERECSDDLAGPSKVSAIDNLTNSLWLKEGIERLDPEEREIIRLRYLQDKPARSVADTMGVDKSKVSRVEHKALKKLKKLL
jgi:RNA polymerase sigma factor (sigma-70 family)